MGGNRSGMLARRSAQVACCRVPPSFGQIMQVITIIATNITHSSRPGMVAAR